MCSGGQYGALPGNGGQRCERHGRFRIWRRNPAADAELLAALLPDPDRMFACGVMLPSPWRGPGTDKVRIELSGHSYFFKRYNCLGALYAIKNLFRRSRAVKSWLAVQQFARRGVPTPEPLLCLEERTFGLLGRAYLLFPFVAGDASSYYELWPGLGSDERKASLFALGAMIGRMHRHGLLHGDLNWRNIIAVRQYDGYRFWLVDLDGSRLMKRIPAKEARRDLAHFLRDLERTGAGADLAAHFLECWRQQSGFPLRNV